MKDAAIALANNGYRIFPCIGKKPITPNGFKDATSDNAQIERWWSNHPQANTGAPTGKESGFIVLDIDLPKGPDSLTSLEKKNGPLPETLTQHTGSGGLHYFFRYPNEGSVKNSAGKIAPGIDIRGDGGYVIMPPSIHESGNRYEWISSVAIAEAPPWLLELINTPPTKKPTTHTSTTSTYGERALIDEISNLSKAVKGSRNEQLNKSAFSLGQLVAGKQLNETQAIATLRSTAINIGLPENEVDRTIQSGLTKGKMKPRTHHQWEPPLLFGETNTPGIPPSLLPVWLGDYVEAIAAYTQTPPSMAIMLALATVATCLQKRFMVSPLGNGYQEPLSLWVIVALPPASRKSAVISALTDPLRIWEKEQALRLAPIISFVETQRDTTSKRIERLSKKAAVTDDHGKREELVKEIEDLKRDMPEIPLPPRLWTGDITPERLQMMLVEHGERMSVLSDEGGIFEVMAGLYNDGKANIDVFLQAHAAQSVRVERAGRSADLNSPALTFGLAIQPAVITDLAQGGKKHFRGKGTLARFLYCLPQNNIGQRNVRGCVQIPDSVKTQYHAGIIDLLNYLPIIDQNGIEQPRILTLTTDAREDWFDFSQSVENKQGTNGEFEPIQDWTGKLPGAVLRIAGLLHVVEFGAPEIIGRSTMTRAISLAQLLIDHAKAAFDSMGADQSTDDAKVVLLWACEHNHRTFTRHQCHNALQGRFRKLERLNLALTVLGERSIISKPIKIATGGRPSICYEVNPVILANNNIQANKATKGTEEQVLSFM